jgi:TonB family protein
VLVRNAPGAWVRDADWDEYHIAIEAYGRQVEVSTVVLIDATGARVEPSRDRSRLVDDTRELFKRYQLSGEVARSKDGGGLLLGSAGVVATGYGVGMAMAPMVTFSNMAAMVIVPAAIIGVGAVMGGAAVYRIVDNSRVDDELKRRTSTLPVVAAPSEKLGVVLHYAITPLPRRIEMAYRVDGADHHIAIDTRDALETVHQEPPLVALSSQPADFPIFALRHTEVRRGYVKAKLTVGPSGRVTDVKVLESEPDHVFDRAAVKAWYDWRFSEARFQGERYVEDTMDFNWKY